MGDDRESNCRAQGFGTHAKSVGIGVEVLPDGGSWPADGCLHRSQCQLVRANRPCLWVFRESLNQRRIAEKEAAAARAAVEAARAQLVGAQSSVSAATASISRIEADIRDSELRSPRDGRVQVRVAQPGEVLGAGGRVLNLLDLSDVYITFFLPETVAGRVALGSEVRIILDAAPEYVIPATVSFVASAAQFTPKTVETASERQKLMFRVRAQISQELLREHLNQVKTGLPGVAWVKLDAKAEWPQNLSVRVPE